MEIKISRNFRSWLVKGGLILVGFLAIVYWWSDLSAFFLLIGDRDFIVDYLQQYGPLGPAVLFCILALQVFLAVIPGHAFIVAGGYIYGLLLGSTITLMSTVIAGQLAFLLTRHYGRPLVDRLAPRNAVDYWQKMAENQGVVFFFFSFVLPIFPNDLMSFVAALGKISPKRFLVANILGRLPCAIFITLIGSHGLEIPAQFWFLGIAVLLGICLFGRRITPILKSTLPVHIAH